MASGPRERPILFSGPMVRAILDGSKSQTRRVVKPQPTSPAILDDVSARLEKELGSPLDDRRPWCVWPTDARREDGESVEHGVRCPYGAVGDRLWVRETWGYDWYDDGNSRAWKRVVYRADDPLSQPQDQGDPVPWKPSIHMPRHLSRLTLEITGVRVERVQDVSYPDIRAEGIDRCELHDTPHTCCDRLKLAYAQLWDSLNGPRGYGWDVNPFVWILEFRRVA